MPARKISVIELHLPGILLKGQATAKIFFPAGDIAHVAGGPEQVGAPTEDLPGETGTRKALTMLKREGGKKPGTIFQLPLPLIIAGATINYAPKDTGKRRKRS